MVQVRRACSYVLAVCLVALGSSPPLLRAQQPAEPLSAPPTTVPGPPADFVPVRLGGQPVIYLATGLAGFPVEERVRRIETVLRQIVGDPEVREAAVAPVVVDGAAVLQLGDHRIMTVSDADAAAVGLPREVVARQWAAAIGQALGAERERYSPAAIARGIGVATVATVIIAGILWVWRYGTRLLRLVVSRPIRRRLRRFEQQGLDAKAARSIQVLIDQTMAVVGFVVLVGLADVYLTVVLRQFPWTRGIASWLLNLMVAPMYLGWHALIAYLPSAFFLVFIAVVALYIIRFTRVVFDAIGDGRIVLSNFPPDWAEPTFLCARVVIIAFALVITYPYLPGAGSPAFTGVSVFAGLLLSMASSSSLSNMVSGLVLIYSRAFKEGDRVQMGETTGDVVARGLLATRVRTPKNVDVVVPNSVVLGSQIVNYSAVAETHGLILHTSVSIGYDVPWTTVHGLLLDAAGRTDGVVDSPAPFVLQTGLGDFYVTYELNASVRGATEVPRIYSDLHTRIQDCFNEAGIEILSPHYTAYRRGVSGGVSVRDARA